MKIKEPTRRHSKTGIAENWTPRWGYLYAVLGILVVVVLIVSIGTRNAEHKVSKKPVVSEERVVTNSQREETKRAEAELQRAKAEYAKVKAELIAVRSWADAEFGKSNAKLQAVVNWLVTPDGELGMPEKEAQRYLDDAMEVCAQRGREIDAVVEAAKRKAHRAGNKLIETKRKARDAGVELEKIAF